MARPKLHPIHPGEVLRQDYLEPLGLSVYRVARDIGVSEQHLGRVLNAKRPVSASLALRVGRYFGTSPQLWLNLQARFDLDIAEDELGRTINRQVVPFVKRAKKATKARSAGRAA